MIKIAIEAQQIFARQSTQRIFTTNSPTPNEMLVVNQFVERLNGGCIWSIHFAFSLLNDDLKLFLELVCIDRRIRVRVRLNLQPCKKSRCRQNSEIRRVVVNRVRIEITATRLRLLRDLTDSATR